MGTSNASVASFGGENRSRSSIFNPDDGGNATSIECATYNSNCLSTLLSRHASTRGSYTSTGNNKASSGGPITNL